MKGLVSWEELLSFLFVGGVLYYGAIVLLFYHHMLTRVRSKPASVKWNRETFNSSDTVSNDGIINKNDDTISSAVHELMQEIKEVFIAALRDHLEQEQILEALRGRMQKYPQVKTCAFKESINQHISNEFVLQLAMLVSHDTLNDLW